MRNANASGVRCGFRRDRLPTPTNYFQRIGLGLTGSGEWRSALCPFHGDTRASLRVNIANGAFRCMACGAHGGDVLAFEILRTSKPFIEACKALGAWSGR